MGKDEMATNELVDMMKNLRKVGTMVIFFLHLIRLFKAQEDA
jgi:hypothetical protein